MKDQKSSSESGVMKAAASAATRVSSWSPSKQEFANRVTNSGSFSAEGVGSRVDDDAVRKG